MLKQGHNFQWANFICFVLKLVLYSRRQLTLAKKSDINGQGTCSTYFLLVWG
jgi:hypothetical protein